MRNSKFVRINKNILLEYIQDDSNLISEEYYIYKNTYTGVNGFLSTLPETNNYINDKKVLINGSVVTKKFTNQLVKLNQEQSQWGKFSLDTYTFLNSKNYGISIPIRYDRIRIWTPTNYVFEEYKGFHLRAYTLDANNQKWCDLSNYFFDISDTNQSDEMQYANPPIYQFEMNWCKYYEIQFPSVNKVSDQVRRGEIRPNTINYNLTDGIGLSREAPVFVDFYFIDSIRKVNRNSFYNLVDKKSITFASVSDYEKFGIVIEPSDQGEFFLIYPQYNGSLGEFNQFIEESLIKGSRYYIEWIIETYEKNIKVDEQKLIVTENFIEEIEFRPIFKWSTTTAIIDVTANLIDSVNGSVISRKSSYGLLQDEVSNYSRYLSKIDLAKAEKINVYKIKGIDVPNLDSSSQFTQRTTLKIDPVSYVVYDNSYYIFLGNSNVQYRGLDWFGNRQLTIPINPFDNIIKFYLLSINELGNYIEKDLTSYSEITLEFRSDKKSLSFEIWRDSDQNRLDIGQVVFKINSDKYGELKRIYNDNSILLYLTGTLNNNKDILWTGGFLPWDIPKNIERIENTFNITKNSLIKEIKSSSSLQEKAKVEEVKEILKNSENKNTSTITTGEKGAETKTSVKMESPDKMVSSLKNDVYKLWNPYWRGEFDVYLKSYQYQFEEDLQTLNELKSFRKPSDFRLFGITLKNLNLISRFELDKVTGFMTPDSQKSTDQILAYLKIYNFNPNDNSILNWISNNRIDLDNFLSSNKIFNSKELVQSSNVPPNREIYDLILKQVRSKSEVLVNPKFIRQQKAFDMKVPYKISK
jgi:hypothetical protein